MKLNYKQTFFIGIAFLSISAFWQLYDGIIPLILDGTFKIGETVTGVVMALDNILALFMLPLFGALSDKTDTPLGRRTPFIIIGTAGAVVFMMLIPLSDARHDFTLFIISLAAILFSMGIYRSPAVALMPDLTPKPLRSKANAVINLMGAIGGIITLAIIKLTVKETGGYFIPFAAVAALMAAAVAVLVLTIKEKKLAASMDFLNVEEAKAEIGQPQKTDADKKEGVKKAPLPREVKKSLIFLLSSVFLWFTAYNAVTTAYSRYVQNVWGQAGGAFAGSALVGMAAAVVSYIPIGFISSHLGRKKVILGGIILMTVSYASAAFYNEYNILMTLTLVVIGVGWAAINVNSYPMVVEMSRGSDIGRYTGYYYTFSMAAQIITPVLSGMLIEHLKIGYRVLFPYALFFSAAAFVTMSLVRHGDSKPVRGAAVGEDYE